MDSDRLYFLKRAEEERAAGVVAPTVEARGAHIELAWRYHNLAKAIAEHERQIEGAVAKDSDDGPSARSAPGSPSSRG